MVNCGLKIWKRKQMLETGSIFRYILNQNFRFTYVKSTFERKFLLSKVFILKFAQTLFVPDLINFIMFVKD